MTAAERGPHKSTLEPDAIEMMLTDVEDKVKDGFMELVYLDEIEHFLGTPEWEYLKISPLAMVNQKAGSIM